MFPTDPLLFFVDYFHFILLYKAEIVHKEYNRIIQTTYGGGALLYKRKNNLSLVLTERAAGLPCPGGLEVSIHKVSGSNPSLPHKYKNKCSCNFNF
jgi:hypothetical protein